MSSRVQTSIDLPGGQRLLSIASPRFDKEVEKSVLDVLRSGQLAQGPKVAEFEALCAEMAGTTFAVAVANGTLALEAALELLGLAPGDEVVTSPFTFGATINAILRAGATVRFADIDRSFVMDASSAQSLINSRTRVLLPVHLYGLMADMDRLAALASVHGLKVVEDAAQAHGARQGDRRAGGTGIGCFSFYATKNVTSAEGGVITTSDADLSSRLRILRNQGMSERYEYSAVGRNLRLTDLAAAVALPQMRRLQEINARRRRNAALLADALATEGVTVTLPQVPPGRTHVWHQFTVLLPNGANRSTIIQRMRDHGVAVGVYYPRLVWDYDCYRNHERVIQDATPTAADFASRCLSLPVHQHLTGMELIRIAKALGSSLSRAS